MLRVTFMIALLPFALIIGFVIVVAAMAGGMKTQLAAACGPIQPSAAAAAEGGADAAAGDPSAPLSAGGLSPVRIAELAMAAGFTGEEVPTAVAVALAESGGVPDKDNRGLNKDGSVDYGLWQINDRAHGPNGFEPARAFDPIYNAVWARRVYVNAGSWQPWTVYKRGTHRRHLPVAQAAAATASPRGEDQAAVAAELSAAARGSEPAAAGLGCAGPTQLINTGFPPEIEPYAASESQRSCDPFPRPGVVDFKNLLLASYPPVSWGIERGCDVGGTSEHKEGRALDWGVDVNNPQQRAAAEDVLGKLLATDEHGNAHALFRRLGLMYIIWNKRIISSNRIQEGWRPYHQCTPSSSPNVCHTNHIHFSFGWAGANRQTSWWTAGPRAELLGQSSAAGEAVAASGQARNERRTR
jgi:hypothetical protein